MSVGRPGIGFGPLKGPDRFGVGTELQPGEILDDGTPARQPPTPTTLALGALSLSTTTERDVHGRITASVRAEWAPPPQGEHPTDPHGVGSYEISYTTLVGTGWTPNQATEVRDVTIRGLPVAADVIVRVRAKTNAGTLGPWEQASIRTRADTVPPPVPSAPGIEGTLRGAAFTWDGLFAGGVLPPSDYQYVEAQFSLDPAFPPSASRIAGEKLFAAGSTAVYQLGTPPFVVHARLRSMDNSGNLSDWSAVTSGSGIQVIPADIGQGAVTTAALAEAAVTAQKILDSAVSTFKLAPGSVVTDRLADLAVATAKIGTNAITSIKLAAGAVTAEKIVDEAIISAKLAPLSVLSDKLAENSVVLGKISENAVDNLALIDGSVTTASVAQGAITTALLAQFAVKAQNVGFGIGGANQLENSSFEDGLTGWSVEAGMTIVSVTGALVHGTMALESTFDPNVGQQPALTP